MSIAQMQDELSSNSSSSRGSSSSSSSSSLPSWYLNAGQKSSDYFLNQLGGLSSLSPYGGERYKTLTNLQNQGIGTGSDYISSGQPMYGAGANLMGQAGQTMSGAGNWQESEMMRHMNPYVNGALTTVSNLANQNLTENVLPGVNSTFTGAGQFGSTRNADFTNRAIRDNQQAISNTQGNMLNQAYDQAANDYYRWDQQKLSAGTAMGGLGQTMGQYGITGLNTGVNLGQMQQQDGQKQLDSLLAAWKEGYTFPAELYNAIGNGYNTSLGRLVPNSDSSSRSSQSSSSSSYNLGSSITI
jgi:hypothetical protein